MSSAPPSIVCWPTLLAPWLRACPMTRAGSSCERDADTLRGAAGRVGPLSAIDSAPGCRCCSMAIVADETAVLLVVVLAAAAAAAVDPGTAKSTRTRYLVGRLPGGKGGTTQRPRPAPFPPQPVPRAQPRTGRSAVAGLKQGRRAANQLAHPCGRLCNLTHDTWLAERGGGCEGDSLLRLDFRASATATATAGSEGGAGRASGREG